MGAVDRFVTQLRELRPRVVPAFLTYCDLRGREVETVVDDRFTFRVIESADDPLLARFAPPWQRRWARDRFADDTVYAIAALDGDELAAHCWVATGDLSGLGNGVLPIKLLDDEAYAFDMFIEPQYRRSSIANFIGQNLMVTFGARGVRYAYTFVEFPNVPSIFWHHGLGFNWVQVFKVFNIGTRVWLTVPGTQIPNHGPVSRTGRHSEDPPQDVFGGSMLPH